VIKKIRSWFKCRHYLWFVSEIEGNDFVMKCANCGQIKENGK
jgi:hypothetical protein